MSFEYDKSLIPKARKLRKNMTAQEKHLWYDFLAKAPLRFQRQKAIGHYIADFYCHEGKLVVEVDGIKHYTRDGMEYDKERTDFLTASGLKVIRFSNNTVKNDFGGVCQKIISELNASSNDRTSK